MMAQAPKRRLPPAYAMFRPLFEQMQPPLFDILTGFLANFPKHFHIGAPNERQPVGEFAGFDGLANRGRLADLLETEWLLRELDGDDFVRRFAENEVLFRRREFEGDGKKNILAVMLDCGPWMLGHNRLVALAALMHLGLRAEKTGAELRWLIPNTTAAPIWHTELSKRSVEVFLGQIVQNAVAEEYIDTALSALNPEGRLECWYVGARQTQALSKHPDISASLLIGNLSATDKGYGTSVDIKARGQRSLNFDVAFPEENLCIAALRRPFLPEVSSRQSKTSRPAKSTLPFPAHWLYDRLNNAIIMRLPEGILYQPTQAHSKRRAIWMPLAADQTLLGIRIGKGTEFELVLGCPGQEVTDPRNIKYFKVIYDADRKLTPYLLLSGEMVDQLDEHKMPNTVLPPLETFGEISHGNYLMSLTTSSGAVVGFSITDGPKLSLVGKTPSVTISSDQTYRISREGANTSTSIAVNRLGHRTAVLKTHLVDDHAQDVVASRHVLYTPSPKMVIISKKDGTFSAINPAGAVSVKIEDGKPVQDNNSAMVSSIALPNDLELLHLFSPVAGLAWDAELGVLFKFLIEDGLISKNKLSEYTSAPVSHVRYCALSGLAYGLEMDDQGNPNKVICLFKKHRPTGRIAFNVNEAIEGAATVWPSATTSPDA